MRVRTRAVEESHGCIINFSLSRRFVGLLLVTKLLPAGDERTVQAVYDAVGPSFLSRLLLPLNSTAVRVDPAPRH